ncbi:FxsA family protein [Roseibium salinum]|nr:FxsA family protein [Roseibium salinum]
MFWQAFFLLIPGFVTDAVGLLLFVPPVREALARFIVSRSDVVIVQDGRRPGKPGERVVDLDEGDWSATNEGSADGAKGPDPSRISPWRDGSDKA